MRRRVLFFSQDSHKNKIEIHVWFGRLKFSPETHLTKLLNVYFPTLPELSIKKNINGKPYLPNFPLHFNLSHSEKWIAIAFTQKNPIGIDIEVVQSIEDMEQLMTTCFSTREQAYVREKNSLFRFWEIWSKKEACFKALGVGLQDNARDWDCFGHEWTFVQKVWVKSLHIKKSLALAISIYN